MSPNTGEVKSKFEVDLILELNSEIIPIEIKMKPHEHIEKSMPKFIDTYKPKNAIVLFFKGEKKEIIIGECKVLFLNLIDALDILKSKRSK